ncbi:MAG: sodium:solute symporter family protein [Planctomycetes bacterium]|nr:sodium:solute symporter family protein [Planctomycetota bacterium]
MIYIIAIGIYLLVLTAIGVVKSRQVKSQEDFALAGRSLSPWTMVLTMLAVWIGTGSILGNAEQAYETGMATLIIPLGTFLGMILLALIASRARDIEATSVPEIIGNRFGMVARFLAVIALIMAYMVIVSYQFNAGGGVIEVITGDHAPVPIRVGDRVTDRQMTRGRLAFTPSDGFIGQVSLSFEHPATAESLGYTVHVVPEAALAGTLDKIKDQMNTIAIKSGDTARLTTFALPSGKGQYGVLSLPDQGRLEVIEPKISKETATAIAAIFIIVFTMLAGLKSLASMDIVTGSIITISLLITFPVLLNKAGGFAGMRDAYALMPDRGQHMQFWGVYSPVTIINYLLPTFLLVVGDANQYQRIFASRNAKGAKQAVVTLVFAALAIELLIIACAWIAGSLTPEETNGRYILIYAARHHLPYALGILFMITVVGVIISTADSFLLVPATTFINDIYCKHINPKADEKRVIFVSRVLVMVFGVIAFLVTHAFAETTGFFDKALYAYTIYGAAVTPSLVAALFWKGATKAGAIASIATGTVVTVVWSEWEKLPSSVAELDAVLPAIILSVLMLVGVSLLTQTPQK